MEKLSSMKPVPGAINVGDCCFNGSIAYTLGSTLTFTTAIVCFGSEESHIWVSGDSSSLYPSWQHNSEHCPLSKVSIFGPCICGHASIALCSLQPPVILYLVNISWLVEAHLQYHCSCETYPISVKFPSVCPLGPQGSLYIFTQYLSLCHVSSNKLFSRVPP